MARKTVKRTLADGTIKTYSYERASKEPRARTVAAIVREYTASHQYRGMKRSSQTLYDRCLNEIVTEYGEVEIAKIKRRHVLAQRDALAGTPGIANEVHKVWTVLLTFALDREYIQFHPALRIRKLKGGEHSRWPDALVEHALTPGVLPEHFRRAVALAVYTGQRLGDCIRMQWSDYDGSTISLAQQKTGKKLLVPCHSALRHEMDAWKATRGESTATTILVRRNGLPWPNGDHFSSSFRGFILHADKHGRPLRPEFTGYVFHGLRKVAAPG
ncbi:integrase (plasmid) [Azospirillum baldaniorum]|uniref:site-specific integrase n=1 Tax=Azospirillum baldaniorum TaxID=1064539 RepID=UPI000D602FDD|nr:tyrosine-type recombinase/integrase [Azospirillum baldaniorum]AWJ93348.1 integrase [Azospirillum baldaniorum]